MTAKKWHSIPASKELPIQVSSQMPLPASCTPAPNALSAPTPASPAPHWKASRRLSERLCLHPQSGKHQGVHVTFLAWVLSHCLKGWRHEDTQVPSPPIGTALCCASHCLQSYPVRLSRAAPTSWRTFQSILPSLLFLPFQVYFPTLLPGFSRNAC